MAKGILRLSATALLLLLSTALAHGDAMPKSIWESQMFAYAVAGTVGGLCYLGMVWETPSERKKREQNKR
jgi:hypothetical protein